ncbi:hypothetical protein [Corynebacterium striatum]|uniref:hypothetical protein n=1 Tax=Corynebacterium striatum TaxID=43770 RepID=UPI0027BAE9DC|nr:hypothetical protein [Corynebacterium striatum]
MFRLLTKLGSGFTLSGKLYFYSMLLLLGCCSTFGLAVGSIWSEVRALSPKHDFIFIGGNMMFWSILISAAISAPLGIMVATMVHDQSTTLGKLGFGTRHYFTALLGQFLKPLTGVLIANAFLYYPIALLIKSLPDDVSGNLLPNIPTPPPQEIGLVVWAISVALPVIVSCLAFSSQASSKGSIQIASKKKRYYMAKIAITISTLGIFTFAAVSNTSQAGIILTIGVLISGSSIVGWLSPRTTLHLEKMLSRIAGLRPWLAISRSITDSHMEKMRGICNLAFLAPAIPSSILTASAIQAAAQGKGGVAAWDFWIILGAPISFIVIGITCFLLLVFQMAHNSASSFNSLGISPTQEFLALWTSYASMVLLSHLALVIYLLYLVFCMAQIWQLNFSAALNEAEWLPIIAVSTFLLIAVPAGFTLATRLRLPR